MGFNAAAVLQSQRQPLSVVEVVSTQLNVQKNVLFFLCLSGFGLLSLKIFENRMNQTQLSYLAIIKTQS